MIKRIVTCDRCGSVVEEPHPDRISIYRHKSEPYTDGFGKRHERNFYKADKPIHLCTTCRGLLDEFFNNKQLYILGDTI